MSFDTAVSTSPDDTPKTAQEVTKFDDEMGDLETVAEAETAEAAPRLPAGGYPKAP